MRLIIASNRLPITVSHTNDEITYKQSSGGLVTGLKCVKSEMDFIWIGNLANTKPEDQEQITKDVKKHFNAVPVFCSPELDKLSYGGFCNKIAWPLLHSFKEIAVWNETYYKAYKTYNDMICETICKTAKDGDVVWIHDYHLMLVPRLLRERCTKKIKIAFFSHIPWPENDVFKTLPVATEIIRGIAGADSIGFHLHSYASNFMDCCKAMLDESDFRNDICWNYIDTQFQNGTNMDSFSENGSFDEQKSLNAETTTAQNNSMHSQAPTEKIKCRKSKCKKDIIATYKFKNVNIKKNVEQKETKCKNRFCKKINGLRYGADGISVGTRIIDIHASPIGIDPNMFREILEKPEVQKRISELKNSFGGKKIILGVDRTDYIKGMPQRAFAYEKYLSKYENEAVFLQVAVPSRLDNIEYSSLLDSMNKIVSRINGANGRLDETNMMFLENSVNFEELVALYAAADLCIISSNADGMNLVALEYIACQKNNHGILMLSKFAGAQSTLPGSVSINPWDTNEIAEKIYECLKMNKQEMDERFEINNAAVEKFTASNWAHENVDRFK